MISNGIFFILEASGDEGGQEGQLLMGGDPCLKWTKQPLQPGKRTKGQLLHVLNDDDLRGNLCFEIITLLSVIGL